MRRIETSSSHSKFEAIILAFHVGRENIKHIRRACETGPRSNKSRSRLYCKSTKERSKTSYQLHARLPG